MSQADILTLITRRSFSDKVTRLLANLICHKENVVSVGELSDVLWTEGECDDPFNALKNLVYRARSVLTLSFQQ